MSWDFSKTLVKCPNKDCRHEGELKEFDCPLEEFELTADSEETILTCPECGCEFHATIESNIDYLVFEGDIVEISE